MSENVVHITVGVLFDLYVKDSISKETYDECIRAYKEYLQPKGDIPITSVPGIPFGSGDDRKGIAMHGPSVDIQFLKDHLGDKWREGIKVYRGDRVEVKSMEKAIAPAGTITSGTIKPNKYKPTNAEQRANQVYILMSQMGMSSEEAIAALNDMERSGDK
ncbi:hypothetical protein [Priestia aryabhattai]|uniref:hypothetical protein n=1 Tax=Priestia aryabhattai TaxID=412384 RepID=UPI0023AFDCB5|nr:hypothetical protein [Priestia aryabhattai]MDE8676464.1 hypothetical protein [Priestia aryabhattai]